MYIELTQGKRALIDDEDYELVKQYKWHYKEQRTGGYAATNLPSHRENGKRVRKMIRMHQIINRTQPGFETDHINGDTLDNRKTNLRTVTRSQNMWNRRKQAGRSKYKGVYWQRDVQKWKAQFQLNGVKYYLGLFDTEASAGAAYMSAVSKAYGEYARLG